MSRNRYRSGDNNVIDDITGFKHKASEMMKLSGEQKGLLTHKSNWNPAHPQLKIRPRPDNQTVRNVRLRQEENFLSKSDVTNLILYSEQLDNSLWLDFNVALTANAIVAPDGEATAEELLDDTANSFHLIDQGIVGGEAAYAASVYVKKKDNRYCFIQCSTVNATYRHTMVFDFDTETITDTETIGSPTSTGQGFEDIGDGWYRIYSSCSAGSSGNVFALFGTSDSGTPSYSFALPTYIGTGTGCYIWGAQLETGTTPSMYVKTMETAVTRPVITPVTQDDL